jgi:hypothetical protein
MSSRDTFRFRPRPVGGPSRGDRSPRFSPPRDGGKDRSSMTAPFRFVQDRAWLDGRCWGHGTADEPDHARCGRLRPAPATSTRAGLDCHGFDDGDVRVFLPGTAAWSSRCGGATTARRNSCVTDARGVGRGDARPTTWASPAEVDAVLRRGRAPRRQRSGPRGAETFLWRHTRDLSSALTATRWGSPTTRAGGRLHAHVGTVSPRTHRGLAAGPAPAASSSPGVRPVKAGGSRCHRCGVGVRLQGGKSHGVRVPAGEVRAPRGPSRA